MLIEPLTWRELFAAVYQINAATSHDDFAASAVRGMQRLVAADVVVFQILDRQTARLRTQMAPPAAFNSDEIAYYTAHPAEFPLVAHYDSTGDISARRLSDVADFETWRHSTYYRTCLARQNLRFCLALPVEMDETTIAALSFNRSDVDFSRRDCDLLDAFAPHLRLAWGRHENPWRDQRQSASERRLCRLGLAPREAEVLFWMTEGKQNREIATILGLRLGTVQDHVASILRKLGQENRHAATVFAISELRRR